MVPRGGIMFGKQINQRSYAANSMNATFQRRIAPEITKHIQEKEKIKVLITGEDPSLTAWLIENLSSISPLNVTLSARGAQRPGKCSRKKVWHE